MTRAKTLIVLIGLALAVPGCCTDWKGLCDHHIEPAFDLQGGHTGAGLVFGTADFNTAGAVLIKVQVEDRGDIAGEYATITVWSGNGDPPGNKTDSPEGGTKVYESGGDVHLRVWTNHVLRNYDPTQDGYWVYVKVDHRTDMPAPYDRDVRYLVWPWTPSHTSSPDVAHDFNEL